jgi:16S rRNA (cytosine967-C5)-methyltransferase
VNEESPREIAIRVLTLRAKTGQYVEHLLDRELARHRFSPQDRALCQELVFGMTRWQATLDWLVARKTGGRAQNATIRLLAELGLYQLFWLQRIPDHAAVHETVELGKRLGFGPRAGFLNAILRGYIREREQTRRILDDLKQTDPALGYSHPSWLVQRWEERWGREAMLRLLQWNNNPAPVFARVNRLKTDFAGLASRWRDERVEFEQRSYDWTEPEIIFELRSHPPLAECGSFQDGLFYVQDPSTLLAVEQLAPHPDQTILDMCAAPGGKTTFIAQRMGNRGRIVACDAQPGRLKILEENCRRLGVTCVQIAEAPDASMEFDRILIDAPCSNTGVLRRRMDLRWRLNSEEIARLRAGQAALLAQAVPRLKPGGLLVYSTCSVEPEENQEVVKAFLGAHPQFHLEGERQLFPFADQADGAYVAKLRKEIKR